MADHDDFVKKLNAEGEGTPRDIQPPTDDATFERQSRDAVKLYRYVSTYTGLLLASLAIAIASFACLAAWP